MRSSDILFYYNSTTITDFIKLVIIIYHIHKLILKIHIIKLRMNSNTTHAVLLTINQIINWLLHFIHGIYNKKHSHVLRA